MKSQAAVSAGPRTSAIWPALTVVDVLAFQGVDPEAGLADDEVARRRERFGSNRFAEAKPEPYWRTFLRQYQDLMQIVLLAAAIASFWPVKEYGTGLVLIVITVFNALLGMQQEGKAAAAVAPLSKMMIVKAKVRRVNRWPGPWASSASSSASCCSPSRAATSTKQFSTLTCSATGPS
jgi:Ca2+-transporting ATPase